jgi:hypothetical protein
MFDDVLAVQFKDTECVTVVADATKLTLFIEDPFTVTVADAGVKVYPAWLGVTT